MAELDEQPSTETAEPSLRDQLEDAHAEIETEVPTAPSDGRARGPDGKFVAKDGTPEAPAARTEAKEAPAATGTAQTETPQPAATGTEPPANWSQADRDRFAKMPAEAKSFVLERAKAMEADYTRKTQAVAALKEYEPVAQMFQPHMAQIRQSGMSPPQLIGAWMRAEQGLMQGGENAVKIVADVVRNYRLDPGAVARALGITGAPAGSPTVATPGQTPNGIDLHGMIAPLLDPLRNQVTELVNGRNADATARMNADIERINGEIAQFRDAKGADGQLTNPHFADVEADMSRLAQAAQINGMRPTLAELYEQAVWSNPATRAKEIAAREAAQRTQVQDAARAKAANARRAGSSVTGAPGPGQSPRQIPTERTLRQELEEAASQQA